MKTPELLGRDYCTVQLVVQRYPRAWSPPIDRNKRCYPMGLAILTVLFPPGDVHREQKAVHTTARSDLRCSRCVIV